MKTFTLTSTSDSWTINQFSSCQQHEMSGIATIQFTQEQARMLTGVSVETVRHWRKTIPYLSAKTGKAARFTFTDVVGLAITHELVNSFGIHIANMGNGVDALFRLLANASPTSLESAIVLITATEAKLYKNDVPSLLHLIATPVLMVPVAPWMEKIQRHVLPISVGMVQVALPFPPEAVRSRT